MHRIPYNPQASGKVHQYNGLLKTVLQGKGTSSLGNCRANSDKGRNLP